MKACWASRGTDPFILNLLMHDHPSYLCRPDVLSLVGDPVSGNECGSPNHIEF